jgi:hypothetical protein
MLNWKRGRAHCARSGVPGARFCAGSRGRCLRGRTDDGGYAYTDDRDQIPALPRRQAAHAHVAVGLQRYAAGSKATSQYAARLERRLAALRELNAATATRQRFEANSERGRPCWCRPATERAGARGADAGHRRAVMVEEVQ